MDIFGNNRPKDDVVQTSAPMGSVENQTVQASTPSVAARPVKKRSAWSTVAFLFLMLFLLAVAAAGVLWYLWQQSQNSLGTVQAENTSLKFNLDQSKQQVARLEGRGEQAAAEASSNDETLIQKAALTYNSLLASPLKDAKVTVTKKDGTQAIATIADTTSGYKAYMKKGTDGAWHVVWTGQNTPAADVVRQFNLTVQ